MIDTPENYIDRRFTDFTNAELDKLINFPLLREDHPSGEYLEGFLSKNNPALYDKYCLFCRDLGMIYARTEDNPTYPQSPVTKQRLLGLTEEITTAMKNLRPDLRQSIDDMCAEANPSKGKTGHSI